MAAGNRHLGYKEALNAIEVTSPGSKHDFYFGFLARASDRFQAEADADQRGVAALPACAARRPRRRSARSAGWSSGPAATRCRCASPRRRCARATRRGEPPAGRRRAGPADRQQEAPLPRHPPGGRRVPLPRRASCPTTRSSGSAEGIDGALDPGPGLPGGAADAGRLRAEDAPRRPGHLPQGPRPDPDAGRHRAGPAGARVGRRVGRAVDDDAAGRRRRSSATSCARTSPPGPRPTSRRSSARPRSSATRSRSATATTASTRPGSTASCSTSPSRGRSCPTPATRPRARRHPRRLHAEHHPGHPAARRARRQPLRDGRDARGAAADLAHRRPGGAPGPPHGGPHRLPHPRARCSLPMQLRCRRQVRRSSGGPS